jgi:2,3-bisphosphoglycerate-independent phosphoglycerate mutase
MEAAVIAAETVDLCLGRLLKAVEKSGGIALVTADHGNLDEMYEIDKKSGSFEINSETGKYKAKTAHTLNPVPFIMYDPSFNGEYVLDDALPEKGLANIASTILNFLGFDPPSEYLPSLIKLKR